MKNKVNHSICMDTDNQNPTNNPQKSSPVCKPTQQEIEADIDMINPDENTLDRG